MPDLLETSLDGDLDQVANYLDLDSDNDGIFDLIEARIGMSAVGLLDANLDGRIDGGADLLLTFGRNGLADGLEQAADSGTLNYQIADADSDGVADYLDRDSDADSLLDTLESNHADSNYDGAIDDLLLPDTRTISVVDNRGVAIGAGGMPANSDGDGLADFRDLDSDNDGITDLVENLGQLADADGDGRVNGVTVTPDSDADGVADGVLFSALAPRDTDGDGVPDYCDADSDQDGCADIIETAGAAADADGDGMVDGFVDLDGNGRADATQLKAVELPDPDADGWLSWRQISAIKLCQTVGRPMLKFPLSLAWRAVPQRVAVACGAPRTLTRHCG